MARNNRGGKKKQARVADASLSAGKSARAKPDLVWQEKAAKTSVDGFEDVSRQTPIFCFRHADTNSTNAWAFCPYGDDAVELLRYFREFSNLTWNDIDQQRTGPSHKRRPKHHWQAVDSIDKAAQSDHARCRLEDTFGDDELFRFRLSGEKRLWGYRRGRVFHVVWWDPAHKVYPV